MAAITYENFDLLLDRSPNGYRAKVTRSLAGEATTEFTLPLSPDELADFLSRMSGGTRQPGSAPVVHRPVRIRATSAPGSTKLSSPGRSASACAAAWMRPSAASVGLRIRLRLTTGVLDLAELPWEFLFAPDLSRFLALSDLTPIVRYIELDRPIQPLRAHLPLTVLAIVSNPSDVLRLAVEHEWENLQDALGSLIQRGVIGLERLEAATLPALQDRLRQGPVDLLHFVGHGFFDRIPTQAG